MNNQTKSSKTLLVTGGAGFIGANFIYYWLKEHPGDQIINLDLLTYAGNLETLQPLESSSNYTFVHGNICDQDIVDKIMDDVDYVVHFAAESHVDRSILNPSLFLETNVLGTQVLLDSALKNKIKRFHHISTDEVFGSLDINSKEKFTLNTKYDPRSPYSASKAASDHLVRAYGETYDLPYTITNCSNNYGQYQYPEKLIPLAITNILENKKVPIYGDGKYVRDWLYVQDHCKAIDLVLTKAKVGKTYLVGGLTDDITNIDLIKKILNMMGKDKDMIEYVKDRPGHDRRYAVDWSAIKKDLAWKPSVDLEQGLMKTIEWYKTNDSWWKALKYKNDK